MALDHLKLYNQDDVPDYIIEQIEQLSLEMIQALYPVIEQSPPSAVLSAMSWVHAALIGTVVVDKKDQIEKAFLMTYKQMEADKDKLLKIKGLLKDDS